MVKNLNHLGVVLAAAAGVLAALGMLVLVAGTPAEAAFPGQNGKIAFTSSRDGNQEIYTMNANGTGLDRLTNNTQVDEDPAWSADGNKIAFTSSRDGNQEIYTMNANGTQVDRLTNNTQSDLQPSWSPDGNRIAFTSNRDGNYEIYAMNANGTASDRLTNNPALDSRPSWSPDGNKIAFRSIRDGNYEIYAMNANGTGLDRLTNNPALDSSPDWQAIPNTTPPPLPPNNDTTAPKVTSTSPKAKAKGVAPTVNVKATFSEDMKASTIKKTTFKLFKKGSTTKIAAAVSYSAATDKATLNPTKALKKGATYRAVVTTGAKDAAGNPLDQNTTKTGLQQKQWVFTVKK